MLRSHWVLKKRPQWEISHFEISVRSSGRSFPALVLTLLRVWFAVNWHNSLVVTILRLNRLLIAPVHRVGSTLEKMWPRNIQNSFWKCLCFSGIWTRPIRRREQPLYQLCHTTLKSDLTFSEISNKCNSHEISSFLIWEIIVGWNTL